MKDIFSHGATDLLFFMLFVMILHDKVPQFLSIAWIVNILFLVGIALLFIYDVGLLGTKIERYINNKDKKEN